MKSFRKSGQILLKKGEPPADGDKFKDEEDKFKKYFSEKPSCFHRVK